MTKKVKILLSLLLVLSLFMVTNFNRVYADPNDLSDDEVTEPNNIP